MTEPEKYPTVRSGKWTAAAVCIFLLAIVWAVFGGTLGHDFVNYDDNLYVYENADVAGGISLQSIGHAFAHIQVDNWHPLTTLSQMLDYQIHGSGAWGYHLTNVLLHGIAAVLLFLVLRRMTGTLWPGAFVAAVFAVHPLHVESVAWVSERKDVLSGVFFMLVLGAYTRHARAPGSPARYGTVVVLFALGLMCKPMLVTLPFVLLLLDYWPLGRFAEEPGPRIFSIPRRLIVEKIPLVFLSACSCVVTVLVQQNNRGIVRHLSFVDQIANALASYVVYLGQMIYPARLAVLYPHPAGSLPVWEVLLAALLLASVSAGVFVLRKSHPFLLVGWLWYLGMLVPVIGLVQVGEQAHADRYTYLPQIGLYVAIAWTVARFCVAMPEFRATAITAGGMVIAGLMWQAGNQVSYWQNSQTLWSHTIAVTGPNAVAELNLGADFESKSEWDEALEHYQNAVNDDPGYAEAHYNLANVLIEKERVEEAIAHYRKALELKPRLTKAHDNLGFVLAHQGEVQEAIAQYRQSLEIEPDSAATHTNLGAALQQTQDMYGALAEFRKALELEPGSADANYNLANLLRGTGHAAEAEMHYKKALEARPQSVEIQTNLAFLLATCPQESLRDGPMAVKLAEQANRSSNNNNPLVLGALAAAYAETGRFPEAVEAAQHAIDIAAGADPGLASLLRSQLALYKAGKPFHDESLQ